MFQSKLFATEINEQKFNVRVLAMESSYFIYIAPEGAETFDNLVLGMRTADDSVLETSILDAEDTSSSGGIAFKLSKKLNKPVYVSCTGIEDRLLQPALMKYLFSEICPAIS